MEEEEMKLYAAFGETDGIWPTTIRRTKDEALAAFGAHDPTVDIFDDATWGGVCIGCFEFDNGILGHGTNGWPKPETVTWLYGYRANKRKDGP